ncbi:MAG: sugar porter family MFS transporter [Cyclobacteriaceae bacterium]|nr:sugar porter family MFS transporter [Cyclobacteriaceae bacterium]
MKKSRKLYLYTFVAALGGLLFGFDTAVINGAIPFFTNYFQLSDALKGWTVSSALIGCVLGALFIGRPADLFGRVSVLKFLGLLFLISAVGTGLATELWIFIVFRFIGGIAVGGASVLSPMYISEISPPAYRGRLTVTFQLAIVTGILVAFFTDYLLIGTGENNWRWMFLSEVLPALLFLMLLYRVEKSPRWLVKTGAMERARAVIRQVDPDAAVEQTLEEIRESIDQEILSRNIYLFRQPFLKLILIGIAIGMFNQFTGINVIMYYATDIFRSAGFSTNSAIGQTVIIGFTNLVFTLLAMRVIDQFGRKNLLLTGSLGMTVFLGLFSWAYLDGNFTGFSLLFFLVGFIAFFAFSQGAVIWVLLAEMFPNNIRARGSSIGSFSHWFFNALTTLLFPIIAGDFSGGRGTGYIFVFYAVATLLSFFFYKTYIIETKGKSLENLEKITLNS